MKKRLGALASIVAMIVMGVAIATPASAADTGDFTLTVKQFDGVPADRTCIFAYSTTSEAVYHIACDGAGGVYTNGEEIPAGSYNLLAKFDMSWHEHMWQWYASPTSGVSDRGSATVVTIGTSPMTMSWTLTEAPIAFSDVPPTHTFYREITDLATVGAIGGYADGTFKSTNEVTRQAFSAFLARLLFSDLDDVPSAGFSDVPDTHTFADEINALATVGLVGGYSDGTFRPSAPVTRQAVAAILARHYVDYHGFEPYLPIPTTFSDVPVTHYFYEEIETVAQMGIVNGYADGQFKPGQNVTRQGVAAMLHRAYWIGLQLPDGAIPSTMDAVPASMPSRS